MSNITVTTKTSNEIAAEFTAVFKEMKPASPPPETTQADRLAPYRTQILKERRRGFSWQQIAKGMADPRINEPVTARMLRKLFGALETTTKAAAKTKKKSTKKTAPKPATAAPSAPRAAVPTVAPAPSAAPDPVPAASPVRRPSRLSPRFQPVFDRVAPTIIKRGYVGDVAMGVLAEAVVNDLRCDTMELNAFILAAMDEFDALDRDTTLAVYPGVKADHWANWRPLWCDARGLAEA